MCCIKQGLHFCMYCGTLNINKRAMFRLMKGIVLILKYCTVSAAPRPVQPVPQVHMHASSKHVIRKSSCSIFFLQAASLGAGPSRHVQKRSALNR